MLKAAFLSILGFAVYGSTAALSSSAALADDDSQVEITVTNPTRGQIISPVVVASHQAGFEPLFQLGAPASAELAMVAEDAILGPLISVLSGNPDVLDVQTIFGDLGPVMPGESASVVVDVQGSFRFISMAGMLVTTNDAFFALRGATVPARGSRTLHSPAYDAGSEANTERCKHIPGPPCGKPGGPCDKGCRGLRTHPRRHS